MAGPNSIYTTGNLAFPREIGLRRNLCENKEQFDSYIDKLNGKASCYTSLYAFQSRDASRHWKVDTDSCIIDRAWWDFDLLEGGSLSDVKEDAQTLLNRLTGDVRVVFTGRGFHIHQMFADYVIGTRISHHIDRYQRLMAKGLKTLDGVGHPQKLTRIPDTYNPKRGAWAVNIDAKLFKEDPHGYEIPSQPDPELAYLDPFTGHLYGGLDMEDDFCIKTWIAQNPVEETQYVVAGFDGDIGSMDAIPIPPCLESLIHHENPKHHVRVALTQHLCESLRMFAHPSTLSGEQKRDIVEKIVQFMATLGWRDYNASITRHHVESILMYENAPSKCLVDVGPCWAHDGVRSR